MNIYQHRSRLSRTKKALQEYKLTVGFIGGSITDPSPGWNWPEGVCSWLQERFPAVRLVVENAGLGATGSDLAVFRAERDLINRGCDLVFIEFAVNDNGAPVEQRARTREGLVRKLLKGEGRDLVFVYTYMQTMYAEMMAGQVPASIAEFENLAEHYQVGSVWMGMHALEEVKLGRMRWEEWLPDGLHPQYSGSASYAQSVKIYLEKSLSRREGINDENTDRIIPAPLNERNWENAVIMPFDQVYLEGPWTIRRWARSAWIDQVLHTSAVGARLSFDFEGRGLLLGFDFGRSSAEFRYRLDESGWLDSARDRPDWCGESGWYRTFLVGDDLPDGRHTFELEVVHGDPSGQMILANKFTGTTIDLALIGIIP